MLKYSALIAAAGAGLRLGFPKLFLRRNGRLVLEYLIESLTNSLCDSIIITVPIKFFFAADLKNMFYAPNIYFLPNFYENQGLIGSVKTALLYNKNSGLLVLPIDQPFVRPDLIKSLDYALKAKPHEPVLRQASFWGQPGHPLYISEHFFEQIYNSDINFNLQILLKNNKKYVQEFCWPDARILTNINYPEDLWQKVETSLEAKALSCS